MDCGEAQDLIVSGEGAAASTLAAHVESCESCRRTQRETARLFAALQSLPPEAPVHAGIEARTMRQVHDVLDTERRRRPWRRLAQWLPAPAMAALAVAVVVSWWPAGPDVTAPTTVASTETSGPAPAAPGTRLARSDGPNDGASDGRRPAGPAAERVRAEPPPELAGAVEMFLELPILENMEKLENFEVIYTSDLASEAGHNG
jgi:hypothetical protein